MIDHIGIENRRESSQMRCRIKISLVHQKDRLIACSSPDTNVACRKFADLQSSKHVKISQCIVLAKHIRHFFELFNINFCHIAHGRLQKAITTTLLNHDFVHLVRHRLQFNKYIMGLADIYDSIQLLITKTVVSDIMSTASQFDCKKTVIVRHCANSGIRHIHRAVNYAFGTARICHIPRQHAIVSLCV